MTVFTANISIKGANNKEVKRRFDLGDFDTGGAASDYAAAESAINQIAGALAAVTDGTLSSVTLTSVVSSDAAAGGGDVFENGMVNVYLDAGGEKVTQLYIPAPVQGIFLATDGKNRDVIDLTDADLVQYVQQVAQHAFVSDGEQIDTTLTNGIEGGVRTVRNLKLG